MRKQSFGSNSTHNVILALGPSEQTNSNPSTPDSSIKTVPEKTHRVCHKDILKSSSNYFNAIFDSQFQEAEASIIFLPRGIFSASVLDDILYFMYTKHIKDDNENDNMNELISGDRSSEQLDQLQSVYLAADYLGMDDLCLAIKEYIIRLTHGLICYCESCICLVPQLLSFAGPNSQNDPNLSQLTHSILKLLIQDPEKTLPTYWSSESMAWLLVETDSLHAYLEARLLEHVNKNNAIEALHGCFLSKHSHQSHWSLLAATQKKVQKASSRLLADHFDFYCTQYPKLLPCVDGIIYSFGFLGYLFNTVLDEMNECNVVSLYKGIVRSLMCRDSVQRTPSVKQILQSARTKTIRFIAKHLDKIKELNTIDKSVIEQLAQDLVVPSSALLADDDSKNKFINKRFYSMSRKKNTHWNTSKIRSRLSTILFGQASYKIGQRVQLVNRPVVTIGTVMYVGKLSGDNNEIFLGLELDRSVGSNDGFLNGTRYFTTSPNRGIFVKPSQIALA
ncbi:Armadillo repeat-containing protein 4 [Rhizopus stolonifer]|uniref:Armadillo repeat-containing protein 4 n=1 Tax=Rhizopus stolonifer TaxID=4846 RepID=A0A367KVV0_RHIST|nr:Armadillo repeat-containing protein 4 [Rhizopus stolonifer]